MFPYSVADTSVTEASATNTITTTSTTTVDSTPTTTVNGHEKPPHQPPLTPIVTPAAPPDFSLNTVPPAVPAAGDVKGSPGPKRVRPRPLPNIHSLLPITEHEEQKPNQQQQQQLKQQHEQQQQQQQSQLAVALERLEVEETAGDQGKVENGGDNGTEGSDSETEVASDTRNGMREEAGNVKHDDDEDVRDQPPEQCAPGRKVPDSPDIPNVELRRAAGEPPDRGSHHLGSSTSIDTFGGITDGDDTDPRPGTPSTVSTAQPETESQKPAKKPARPVSCVAIWNLAFAHLGDYTKSNSS